MEPQRDRGKKGKGKQRSNPYERFTYDEMILRDHLAVDRTILANERTFLAYARTFVALVLAGATVLRIFENPSLFVGWALIVLGVIVGGLGTVRTRRTSLRIRAALSEPDPSDRRAGLISGGNRGPGQED
ncbi:MAG: DUF202 domain-containing protein [Alkalispirochaetaceae bacterium]